MNKWSLACIPLGLITMSVSSILAYIAISHHTLGFWTASICIPLVLSLIWLTPLVLAQALYYKLRGRTLRKENKKKFLASIEQYEAERKAGDEAFEGLVSKYRKKREIKKLKQ